MRVLVACEFSGVVRRSFRSLGHDAWSCDIIPAEDGSEFHILGDALEAIKSSVWDLMIAHPPCTYLCNSGVRHLYGESQDGPVLKGIPRWKSMIEGALFFRSLLHAPIPKIAIENPVMHKYAKQIIGRGQDFSVQPWNFGDLETKRTCFWTKGLHRLKPDVTEKPSGVKDSTHKASPGPDRGKDRSVTFQGIANAMAQQWGA